MSVEYPELEPELRVFKDDPVKPRHPLKQPNTETKKKNKSIFKAYLWFVLFDII